MLKYLMDVKKIINDLKGLFECREEIAIAFIFGSFVNGRLSAESDIDIAISFNISPDFGLLSQIEDEIYKLTGLQVDIVILNNASPIIRMQILKKGVLLKKVNDRIYSEFFLKTIKEYDDLKQIRRQQEQNILKGRIYA